MHILYNMPSKIHIYAGIAFKGTYDLNVQYQYTCSKIVILLLEGPISYMF